VDQKLIHVSKKSGMSAALLCVIDGSTVGNTLFEDDDSANTFRAFNSTQTFLIFLKKLLLTCCGEQANMLAIILLRNGNFLKYFFL
jgi:hypothetical protein